MGKPLDGRTGPHGARTECSDFRSHWARGAKRPYLQRLHRRLWALYTATRCSGMVFGALRQDLAKITVVLPLKLSSSNGTKSDCAKSLPLWRDIR